MPIDIFYMELGLRLYPYEYNWKWLKIVFQYYEKAKEIYVIKDKFSNIEQIKEANKFDFILWLTRYVSTNIEKSVRYKYTFVCRLLTHFLSLAQLHKALLRQEGWVTSSKSFMQLGHGL
jgi:hypothetical protein